MEEEIEKACEFFLIRCMLLLTQIYFCLHIHLYLFPVFVNIFLFHIFNIVVLSFTKFLPNFGTTAKIVNVFFLTLSSDPHMWNSETFQNRPLLCCFSSSFGPRFLTMSIIIHNLYFIDIYSRSGFSIYTCKDLHQSCMDWQYILCTIRIYNFFYKDHIQNLFLYKPKCFY